MFVRWCLLISTCLCSALLSAKPSVKIGYQSMNGPFLYIVGSQQLERLSDYSIEWKKFESGAKMSLALASKEIDIGMMGSTPFAVAISQPIPIQIFSIAADIHRSEALIAHPRSAITQISDLRGKKVATPFASTAHFHLMVALEQAGVSPQEVRILNYAPAQIAAAWHTHAIDAAFIWQPLLQQLENQQGQVLVRSADIRQKGPGTFDAFVVRTEWAAQNNHFLQIFVRLYDQEVQTLRQHPEKWSIDSPYVQINAKLSGARPEEVLQAIQLYHFPTQAEQKSTLWFGAHPGQTAFVPSTIEATSQFLFKMGFTRQLPPQFSQFIQPVFPQ